MPRPLSRSRCRPPRYLIAEARLGGLLGRSTRSHCPNRHSGLRARVDRRSVVGATCCRVARRSASVWRCPRRSAPTARRSPRITWPGRMRCRSAASLHRLLARAGLGEVPVHVGNDANLAALAESRHGAGQGAAQMLYVMTGQVGVGGGLVIDGRLHLGSAGYALEIGHTPVPPGIDPAGAETADASRSRPTRQRCWTRPDCRHRTDSLPRRGR